MPKKYNISIDPAPPRFTPIGKSTILDWEGGCLRCFKCVKRKCIYGAYNERTFDISNLTDTIDSICKNCLRCVQECPGQVITKIINPEYTELGDSYWTPDIISRQWFQAETGKIPVSGAGYSGPFSGPGFDEMWTDMSEIVRPTRDGIHGREYINTSVSLGRKLPALSFTNKGNPILDFPKNLEIPIPMIFGELPIGSLSRDVYEAMAKTAMELDTLIEIPVDAWDEILAPYKKNIIPLMPADRVDELARLVEGAPMIEIYDSGASFDVIKDLKSKNPDKIVMIKVSLNEDSADRVEALSDAGADIIHVAADRNGDVYSRNNGGKRIGFVKDVVRKIHTHLVDAGRRDAVTLIAGGGIAMAEHVAKQIICGADAVSIDIPILLALECRVCLRCQKGLSCPVQIENVHPDWAGKRIKNLMAAWRNQLLEVLGAMGLREAKRLRGEVGRSMFFQDLEADTFGKLFGRRTDSVKQDDTR